MRQNIAQKHKQHFIALYYDFTHETCNKILNIHQQWLVFVGLCGRAVGEDEWGGVGGSLRRAALCTLSYYTY